MQTHLASFIKDTPAGKEAETILRSCVHCGFCKATCPTYQLLGDELDGPRGRIYLMKQLLEGQEVSQSTQQHLDRCLTCRNCETTCPSGVQYGRLVDLGRELVEQRVSRPLWQQLQRGVLRKGLQSGPWFGFALRLGQTLRPLLPQAWAQRIPPRRVAGPLPQLQGNPERTMILLEGCVQPALSADINGATRRVLARLGIAVQTASKARCCGALDAHLGALAQARQGMRRNIDAWWPLIEAGAEAIVITASGCGTLVKEYGHHLQEDPQYREKAARVSRLCKDLSEILAAEDLAVIVPKTLGPIAFHAPCSLQHGQQLPGVVEGLLQRLGFQLQPVKESHLCCGSAGTYSLLQPKLSAQLRDRKLNHLQAGAPSLIATANIGCQLQLASRASVPVMHWVCLLDDAAP